MYIHESDRALSSPDKIRVLGIGDGGCHSLAFMSREWNQGPELIAVNSDSRSLELHPVSRRMQIGNRVARGLGSGGDPKLGRMAAQEDIESFREVFSGIDVAFFVVGLGGGTGTGATPILVDSAKQNGVLTICFATLPFGFEGMERHEVAQKGMNELRTVADAVVVVPNERLFDTIQGQDNLVHSFKQTDQVLSQSVLSIWTMITRHGLINLDFADLRRVISATGGTCVFGNGSGAGFCKANDAIRDVLTSPLLVHGQLVSDAAGLLVSILGGPDLTLSEIDDMMRQVTDKSDENARVCMGVVIDDDWRDRVSVTIIASETWGEEEDPQKAGESKPASTRVRKNKDGRPTSVEQTSLQFESYGKGKFKDVEPTLMDGTDLDIPTFWRRGIPIEK